MRPRGWRFGILHSPTVTQITLSPVQLSVLLSDTDSYVIFCNKILLNSFNIFYASGKVCILLTINVCAFYSHVWLINSCTVPIFIRSGIEMAFHIEMYFDVRGGFIDPI